MNKKITTILTTAAVAVMTGCATAGTWVNGFYIDGPLCTVCDGMRVVAHAYGTTVCTHCDGTGIEPPEETVVVENVIVGGRCPPPPPRWHGHRPPARPNPPRHIGRARRDIRPPRPAHGGKQPPRAPRQAGGQRRGRR